MIYRPRQQPTQAAAPEELGVERERVVLTWDGERREVPNGDGTLTASPLGRLSYRDLVNA